MRDAVAHAAEPPPGAPADGARLTGAPLALARGAWIVTTVVSLGLFVAAIPLAYQQLITPQSGQRCADSRFSPAQFAALHAAGISPTSLAVWIIAVQGLMTLVCVGVGALLFWRRSEHHVALLAATALVLVGVTVSDTHWLGAACALRPIWPAAGVLFDLLGVAANLLVAALFCTFPSGRWVPGWSPLLVLCFSVTSLPATLRPAVMNDLWASHPWVGMVTPLLIASFLVAQVYRYWRVSTPAERVQTKWVVLGSGIGVGENVVLIAVFGFYYSPTMHAAPLFLIYAGTAIQLGLTLFPVSIGIALLRSHLFDVDTIINRVLVYGVLTGVLAVLYVALVFAAQSLLRELTGQSGENPVIIVATTLLMAALFTPLRRVLQRGIDRRFYRRKYDAAHSLVAFSATLRDEVDLAQLRENLLDVVETTMQPAYVLLWVRPPSGGGGSSGASSQPSELGAARTMRPRRADAAEPA